MKYIINKQKWSIKNLLFCVVYFALIFVDEISKKERKQNYLNNGNHNSTMGDNWSVFSPIYMMTTFLLTFDSSTFVLLHLF